MDVSVAINNTNSDVTWCTDALQAVKLDPAVIEAQITMDKVRDTNDTKSSEDTKSSAAPASFEAETEIMNPIEDICVAAKTSKFEDMMKMQKAALLSLSPQRFALLLKYAEILRMQRLLNQKQLECAFCKNNGEPASWYSLHMLKDKRGRVRCPVLRGYRCPGCGATGDKAHTIKYCPLTDRVRWTC